MQSIKFVLKNKLPLMEILNILYGYIYETKVLIEQKSSDIDLDKKQVSHNGKTPYEQAFEYNTYLPAVEKANWLVICNFKEIRIYDMNKIGEAKLKVLSVTVQKSVRNLVGRSVRADALCQLGSGEKVNIEIQRLDNDHHLKRIRYNASCITAGETEPGDLFEHVPTVIMVFISEFDFLEGNRTIYHIDHVIRETGMIVDNGLHTVCVNTKIDDGTDIAELMKCFMQTEVDNDKFPAVSKRMKYLKHSEGGLEKMCKIMEEYVEERIESHTDEQIEQALAKGKNPQDIADYIGVSVERVMEVQERKTVLV